MIVCLLQNFREKFMWVNKNKIKVVSVGKVLEIGLLYIWKDYSHVAYNFELI
jgi:hypothetical protein